MHFQGRKWVGADKWFSSSDHPNIQRWGDFNVALVWALWLTHVVRDFLVLLTLHVVLHLVHLIRILNLTQLHLLTIMVTDTSPSGTLECLYICPSGTNQCSLSHLGCCQPSSWSVCFLHIVIL